MRKNKEVIRHHQQTTLCNNVHNDQSANRKAVERNRRGLMKDLCSELTSLLPTDHYTTSKETPSQKDQLLRATSYIKQLGERVEELKVRKEQALATTNPGRSNNNGSGGDGDDEIIATMQQNQEEGLGLPFFELKDINSSALRATLITQISSKNYNINFFVLAQLIEILEEEGAEIVQAGFDIRGYKVFHTVYAQVKISRLGVETSRVYQKLQQLADGLKFG